MRAYRAGVIRLAPDRRFVPGGLNPVLIPSVAAKDEGSYRCAGFLARMAVAEAIAARNFGVRIGCVRQHIRFRHSSVHIGSEDFRRVSRGGQSPATDTSFINPGAQMSDGALHDHTADQSRAHFARSADSLRAKGRNVRGAESISPRWPTCSLAPVPMTSARRAAGADIPAPGSA